MTVTLVHPDVVEKWDRAFAGGSDKRYPSLDLVRLEKWFFKGQPGRLLEYGCGSGVNLIHMLECGYESDAIDASSGAIESVRRKLSARPDIEAKARLHHLSPDASSLPFEDDCFDYVTSINVLSLLASRERVGQLLSEFRRVMKPGAKILLDINAPNADFARDMKYLGDDVYAYVADDDNAVPTYCPKDVTFHDLVREYFDIDDTGYTSHSYCGSEITEYIVCAHKS